MMKMAIKSASAVLSRRNIWCRTGLYWLDGKSGLSACQFGLYRNAAGFQRIDVAEDADLSLPDASHSKSYAGYGTAASLFNTKVRILAQKRLRDRLKIYLQTLTPDEKGCYSLPYTRTELADFLCVDRSALSRELCRMRDERILDFSGAKIHLLNPTFLYGWN